MVGRGAVFTSKFNEIFLFPWYLFIKHIDHEDALDSVSMDVSQNFDFEVAKSDAGEVPALLPLSVVHEIVHDVETVETLSGAQEAVQEEYLSHDVDGVENLHADVEASNGRSVVPRTDGVIEEFDFSAA